MVVHIITRPSKSLGRAFRRCIALNLELSGYNQYKIPARTGGCAARDLHYREQTRAVCAQTSLPKFLKFRLFFHLDHVWHRFDHAFGKERLGVCIHGVKLGFRDVRIAYLHVLVIVFLDHVDRAFLIARREGF